ncbi:MAG TPA: hypothetical protein VI874_00895 [Candidatus Norongarragalinales archaeon]|nr:hypothetical protein [Candidatus Norongarragalinales archaeon]
MEQFYCWYDNGSGYFEADSRAFPVLAASAEEALEKTGGPQTNWGSNRVVTASSADDPNSPRVEVLAGKKTGTD